MMKLSKIKIENLALFILLIIGFGLRFYDLGTQSLWNDELDSWLNATFFDGFFSVIEKTKGHEPHPPLYWVFLHYWAKFFGDSEYVLRLPSAIVGCATLLMVYYLGAKYFSKKAGLISLCFVIVNMDILLYHQMARGNSIAVFFSLVCLALFLEVFAKDDASFSKYKAKEIGYFVLSLAVMYFHYSAFFAIVAHGLSATYLVYKKRDLFKKYLVIYSLLAICYIPQILTALKQSSALEGLYQRVGFYSFIEISRYVGGNGYLLYLSSFFIIVTLAWCFCVVFGKKYRKIDRVFIISSFFPLAFIILWSCFDRSIFSVRNGLCGIIVFYVLMGHASQLVLEKVSNKTYLLLCFLIIFTGIYDLKYKMYYYRENRLPPWNKLVKEVANSFDNKDYVVFSFSYGWGYYRYYANRYDAPFVDYSLWLQKDILQKIEEAEKLYPNKKIVFLELEKGIRRDIREKIVKKYDIILYKNYRHVYDYVNPMRINLIKKR
jgi:uncharacterized membrane protein